MRTPIIPRRALLTLNTLWLTAAPLPALACAHGLAEALAVVLMVLLIVGLLGVQLLFISAGIIFLLWRGRPDHARLRRIGAGLFSLDLALAATALGVGVSQRFAGDARMLIPLAVVFGLTGALGWWSTRRAPAPELLPTVEPVELS